MFCENSLSLLPRDSDLCRPSSTDTGQTDHSYMAPVDTAYLILHMRIPFKPLFKLHQ